MGAKQSVDGAMNLVANISSCIFTMAGCSTLATQLCGVNLAAAVTVFTLEGLKRLNSLLKNPPNFFSGVFFNIRSKSPSSTP